MSPIIDRGERKEERREGGRKTGRESSSVHKGQLINTERITELENHHPATLAALI